MKYNFQCPVDGFKSQSDFGMLQHLTRGKFNYEEHSRWIDKRLKGRIDLQALRDLIKKRCKISDKPNTQRRAKL
jgi:hypothetical protein